MTEATKVASSTEIDIFASLKVKGDSKAPIQVKEEVRKKLSTLDTKSKMIRFLTKEGYTTHQISKVLGIRYQHVYNVQHQTVKS